MAVETEEALTAQDLGKVGARALEYQRYVFRRTYGVYYLIWAAAIALLVSNIGGLVGLRGDLGGGANAAVSLAILALAVAATTRIFGQAMRALRLSRALGTEGKGSRAPYFVAWVAAIVVIEVAVGILAPANSEAVLYGLLLPVPFVIYYMLGMAFPDGRPTEGLLALAAYGSAAALSLALSLLAIDPSVIAWAWGATVLVWSLAAFYALFRAPDELEALRG
jgi:hypothetical protein